MMYNSFNEVKKMENGVLLQGFHWYIKPEEKLWKQAFDQKYEKKHNFHYD